MQLPGTCNSWLYPSATSESTREHRQCIPQTCSQEGRSWHCHSSEWLGSRGSSCHSGQKIKVSLLSPDVCCLSGYTPWGAWSAPHPLSHGVHSQWEPYNYLPPHRPLHVPQPLASAQQHIQLSTTLQHLVLAFPIPSRLKSHVSRSISCHRSIQVTSQHHS